MATCFDRWEKDPFFSAAEEVQESADRMESTYRRWIHDRKDLSNPQNGADEFSGELLRDLQTTLGTAKWQLEELDRAVRSNDEACSAGEDTRSRHGNFVEAIGNQITMVENSIKESKQEKGESNHPWVRLDEGERDELALFLFCPLPEQEKDSLVPNSGEKRWLDESGKAEPKEESDHGHRRTASACADTTSWNITVPVEDSTRNLPPPRIPSFSILTRVLKSSSKVKLSKNGFRKCKANESDSIPVRNHLLSRGCNACYERSKSCLSCCGDEVDDKQLYGWFGALQRQLQRSQYQIQYGRPIQMILWAIIVLLLIVLLAVRAI